MHFPSVPFSAQWHRFPSAPCGAGASVNAGQDLIYSYLYRQSRPKLSRHALKDARALLLRAPTVKRSAIKAIHSEFRKFRIKANVSSVSGR